MMRAMCVANPGIWHIFLGGILTVWDRMFHSKPRYMKDGAKGVVLDGFQSHLRGCAMDYIKSSVVVTSASIVCVGAG
jgi:hypothetical protein